MCNFSIFGAASIQVRLLFEGGLCAIFQFFGAASIQVRLLFEGGLYAQSWVCKTRKKRSGACKIKVKLDMAIVLKLFQM